MTYSGIDRRDLVFPNREDVGASSGRKFIESEIEKEEVNQTSCH